MITYVPPQISINIAGGMVIAVGMGLHFICGTKYLSFKSEYNFCFIMVSKTRHHLVLIK